jgi:thiol-disulfide isomerase/thioredoxin
MKIVSLRGIVIGAACLLFMSFTKWQPDLETAKQVAKEKHHHILLTFSGSDWCVPCIKLHEEILSNGAFLKMADSSLEMVNADFPRKKKNQLPLVKAKANEALADIYNPEGKFPFTLLLDEDGKVLKTWDGFVNGGPSNFALAIKKICDAGK